MEGGGRAFVAATKQVTMPGNYLQYVLFFASQVRDPGDIIRWEASEAYQVCLTSYCYIQLQSLRYQEYLGFIIAIGDAVKGRKLTEEVCSSVMRMT